MLVWIDCEMTGLDLAHDELIEVACLVTDGELNIQGDGIDVVIRASDEAMANMGEFVTEMHTTSGLLEDLRACTTTMREAEERVLAYIKQYVPEPRKAPLAGNTIGTDRSFLLKDMPELEGYVHYRNIDVSSIKELARRWYPRTFFHSPEKHGGHRALADILESIDELRYYRRLLFPAGEGPTSEECRSVAEEISAHPTSSTF